jgi:hypothetical protein
MVKTLSLNLQKMAHSLPEDPNPNSIFCTLKMNINWTNLMVWILFLSPLAYNIRYFLIEIIGTNILKVSYFSLKIMFIMVTFNLI